MFGEKRGIGFYDTYFVFAGIQFYFYFLFVLVIFGFFYFFDRRVGCDSEIGDQVEVPDFGLLQPSENGHEYTPQLCFNRGIPKNIGFHFGRHHRKQGLFSVFFILIIFGLFDRRVGCDSEIGDIAILKLEILQF